MTEQRLERAEVVAALSRTHQFSEEAVAAALASVIAGGGRAAQFSHPELGGMGQWSQGGMIMIGDMFNHALKDRVARLCADIAAQLPLPGGTADRDEWFPTELGTPVASGAQNGMRYAFFPTTRRLAIDRGGNLSLYDTGDHRITGFSQQQSLGKDLAFTTPEGPLRLDMLRELRLPATGPRTAPVATEPAAGGDDSDVYAKLEKLHGLHARGVLTDGEYAAKKAELLARI